MKNNLFNPIENERENKPLKKEKQNKLQFLEQQTCEEEKKK